MGVRQGVCEKDDGWWGRGKAWREEKRRQEQGSELESVGGGGRSEEHGGPPTVAVSKVEGHADRFMVGAGDVRCRFLVTPQLSVS